MWSLLGSHDQDVRHAHIWLKPFKNLLQNWQADFHETWYVALGTPAHHSYAPNFEKVGDILVSACPYVCTYVCMYVRIHVRDIVLKLHVWIPHEKVADAYFWFSLNYLPLSNYGPLTNKGMKFCKCCISKSVIARNLKLVSADRG